MHIVLVSIWEKGFSLLFLLEYFSTYLYTYTVRSTILSYAVMMKWLNEWSIFFILPFFISHTLGANSFALSHYAYLNITIGNSSNGQMICWFLYSFIPYGHTRINAYTNAQYNIFFRPNTYSYQHHYEKSIPNIDLPWTTLICTVNITARS